MNEPLHLPHGWARATVGQLCTVRYGKGLAKKQRVETGQVEIYGSAGLVGHHDQELVEEQVIVVGRKGNAGSVWLTQGPSWPIDTTYYLLLSSGPSASFLSYQLCSLDLVQMDSSTTIPSLRRPDLEATTLAVAPVAEQRRIVERIEEIFVRLDAIEMRLKSLLDKLRILRSAILANALHTNRDTLPRGWRKVALSDVAQIILGQSPPGTSYNDTGDGVAFFQGKTEFGKLYPIVVKWTTEPKRLAKQNDILLSVRAPVGPTNLAPVDCAIGRGLHAIRPNPDIDHLFLLWALRASVDRLRDQSTGSTFNAVTGQQVKKHKISIPPLVEQTRLVKSIEAQFSYLNTTEASVIRGLELATTLRRSVLAEAFTGRLVPQDPNDEPASVLLKGIAASRPAKPKRWRKARA